MASAKAAAKQVKTPLEIVEIEVDDDDDDDDDHRPVDPHVIPGTSYSMKWIWDVIAKTDVCTFCQLFFCTVYLTWRTLFALTLLPVGSHKSICGGAKGTREWKRL